MKINVSLNDKIRRNHFFRVFFLPFVRIKRKNELVDYHKRVNTTYFESIKGSRKGERCFIIGNGPSLKAKDLDLLKGETTFAFNRIFDIYKNTQWRPTYYMVTDKSVINSFIHMPIIETGAEKTFVYSKKLAEYWGKSLNIQEIFLAGKVPIVKEKYYVEKLSNDVADHFTANQSVTVNAFELAFYMGFSEIYLLGVDHDFAYEVDMDGNKRIRKDVLAHFEEDEDDSIFISYKDALTKCYETCRTYADRYGIKVYNVTRGGKLKVFERKNLEDVIKINDNKL